MNTLKGLIAKMLQGYEVTCLPTGGLVAKRPYNKECIEMLKLEYPFNDSELMSIFFQLIIEYPLVVKSINPHPS